MMAAEQWYEHSENYRRYGLIMKPEADNRTRVKKEKPEPASAVAPKEKAALIFMTIFIGILCVGMIISTAYCAKIKYQINTVIKENTVLQGEIENLQVEIKSAANIQTISDIAVNRLGMFYPTSKDKVYLNEASQGGTADIQDFVLAMKVQAYSD